MSFFDQLNEKVGEETKSRKAKALTDLNIGTQESSSFFPKLGTGNWKRKDEEEQIMADIYSLGSVTKAYNIYHDKNSHAGTQGNIYKGP